jgi:hypothetical protein
MRTCRGTIHQRYVEPSDPDEFGGWAQARFALLKDGWIERFKQEDVSRDKQAYRLTQAGRMGLSWN